MKLCSKTFKKIGFSLSCVAVAALFVLVFSNDALAAGKRKPVKHLPMGRPAVSVPVSPAGPPYSDLIIDAGTGRVLHETDSTAVRHPASLTKMMTLYLTFQAIERGRLRLDTSLTVSANASRQSPSKLCLRPGQHIRVYDAIMAVVTKSANDVAVVLAENIGGSVPLFVGMMNAQARELGMRQTYFHNPSGLPDPEQVSSARDMATLALALISHYPGFYPYFSHQTFVYNGEPIANHNHLMSRYQGMDGIKTGYVSASGFNLVASAVHGRTRLIGVIFGGHSAAQRDRQMEALLDAGFAEVAGATPVQQAAPMPREAALTMPSKEYGSEEEAETPAPPVVAPKAKTAKQAKAVQAPIKPADKKKQKKEAQPKAATPEKQAKAGSRAWGVQVGSFNDVITARQTMLNLMHTLKPTLSDAQPSLQKITMTDGAVVYRARFVGLDQAAARSVCAHLTQKGQSCLVFSGS